MEINGDIVQFFPKGNLILYNDDKELKGNYGHRCWWIPLSKDKGIKIYNRFGFKEINKAELLKNEHIKKWKIFYNRTNNCRKYLPEIYDWTVIKHTGKYIKGGYQHHWDGNNVDMFYPACIQRLYEKPKTLSNKNKKEIKDIFNKDGIYLNSDTFSIRQLGLYNNNFIVLDLHIKGEGKII